MWRRETRDEQMATVIILTAHRYWSPRMAFPDSVLITTDAPCMHDLAHPSDKCLLLALSQRGP